MGSLCGGEENALRAAQVNRGAIAYGHLTRDRYRHHAGGYTLLTHRIWNTPERRNPEKVSGCQTPSKTPDTGHVAKSAHIYNDEY